MSNFTVPRFRIQDALGNAVVGGTVTFYEPGTVVPKGTFSDVDLTVANANPITSGSDGWTPEVWMSPEPYKVVVKDAAGATLTTYDPYWPARSEQSAKVIGTSADADPAVLGTNSSSGPGVKAVSTGNGNALWVEGDTSAPAKAALHVVPQDNFPTSPVVGMIQPRTKGGTISTYDGITEQRVVRHGINRPLGSITVASAAPGSLFPAHSKLVIPVGYIPAGGMWADLNATVTLVGVGAPACLAELLCNGVVIATKTLASVAAAGDSFHFFMNMFCDSYAAQFFSAGIAIGDAVSGKTAAADKPTWQWTTGSIDNSTTEITIEMRMLRTGGTSVTASSRAFNYLLA